MYNGGIFAVRDLQGKMSAKCEVRNAKLIAFINPFRIPHSAFCIPLPPADLGGNGKGWKQGDEQRKEGGAQDALQQLGSKIGLEG